MKYAKTATELITMKDKTYENIIARWQQVMEIPPQELGPFTSYFKIISSKLKVMPWMLFLFCSLLFVTALFMFFGSSIIFIVETLQRGF